MPKELELLDEWSNRLGLKDWLITLETDIKPDDMELHDCDGEIGYTEATKAARIRIIDPKYRKEVLRPFDFEETLVHELLHIKMCLLEQGTDWDTELQLRLLHQILDDIARALVDAKRSHNDIT